MTTKIKTILAEKLNMDGYRTVLIAGVFICIILQVYLALIKDTSRETVFIEPNANQTRIIVLDHIINEGLKTDSIIKTEYYAIPDYGNATADSLQRIISERYKKR